MKIILNSTELKKELKNNHNIGFVPTMGSIHKGHEYLILRSKKVCRKTLVSIYVNPTQFDNKKDLRNYPKNIKKDLSLLKNLNVDYVFIPKTNDIYKQKKIKRIRLKITDKILCAKFRKGHFEGVLNVMDRLIKIISPNKVFMGEKDFQQYYLVKKFFKHNSKIKVIKCKTIRTKNKVALSSRNFLLSKKNIFVAEKVIKELFKLKKKISKSIRVNQYLTSVKKDLIQKYKIKIEYLEIRNVNNLKKSNFIKNSKIFIAYYLDDIRLIDNL